MKFLCFGHMLSSVHLFSVVFYVKRSGRVSGQGGLWSLGRTQFSCPSRDLRDQWVTQLRMALKTHSKQQ